MISNGFYNYHNLKQEYLGGKVKHYPIKDASITLEWYEYIVKANETLYTIAARVFGEVSVQNWTFIADNNPPIVVGIRHTNREIKEAMVIVTLA